MIIDYELLPAGGTALRYRVDTERPISQGDASSPAWTALEYSQCPNCPYAGSHCPAALDVAPLVEALGAVVSHARMRVRVHSAERVIESEADVQTVLSALLGLLLASSRPSRALSTVCTSASLSITRSALCTRTRMRACDTTAPRASTRGATSSAAGQWLPA